MSMNNAERLERRFFVPWQFWIAAGFVLLMSGWILIRSIHRPYDSVPDQDLLWLSEALRLYRGAQTTYIDHPGALWTLMYLVNLYILQSLGAIHYTVGEGIGVNDAGTLIRMARAENSLLCAVTLISLWPISRWLGVNKNQTMLWIIILSCSSGFLWGMVQVRHEMASILFASLFLLLSKAALKMHAYRPSWGKLVFWSAAISSLMLSMYCKIQIIFAFPILIIALLPTSSITKGEQVKRQYFYIFNRLGSIEALSLSASFLITIGIVGRYTAEQGYAFDLRSVGFWLCLNAFLSIWGLVHLRESAYSDKSNKSHIAIVAQNSIILCLPVFIELFFAAVVFRGGWTAGWSGTVFRAPTELFGGRGLYYSGGNEAIRNGLDLSSLLKSLSNRLEETYFLPSAVIILLFAVIALLLSLKYLRNTPGVDHVGQSNCKHYGRVGSFNGLLAMGAICLTVTANSARDQNFYAIYIAIPTLLVISFLNSQRNSRMSNTAIQLASLALCAAAITRAAVNLHDVSRFTTFNHHGTLCYGQQMDIEMRLTSIGQCPNFKAEMKA